jgi:hypothetical protein
VGQRLADVATASHGARELGCSTPVAAAHSDDSAAVSRGLLVVCF